MKAKVVKIPRGNEKVIDLGYYEDNEYYMINDETNENEDIVAEYDKDR